MERNLGFEAQIIINDMASMCIRIEQLQAHQKYTEAMTAAQRVRECMMEGLSDIHQHEMRQRFASKSK